MLNVLKSFVRNLLPGSWQVPMKYWYGSMRGTIEEEMKILGLLVASGDRVIDVGANRGIYAYRLWKLGARVEVFEPNPVCLRVLEAWAAGRSRVAIHPVALSSRAGPANLHIPIDDFGIEHDASASIEHDGFAHGRDQLVRLQTLDSFEFRDVRLVKIDVEGHEYSVIEGAATTIGASMPALLVEIEQRHCARPIDEVFWKIMGFGYRGFFLGKEGLEPLGNFDVARDQSTGNFGNGKGRYINNFLFLHESKLVGGDYGALVAGRLAR